MIGRRRSGVVCVALAIAIAPRAITAQAPTTQPATLTLERVIAATLRGNASILSAAQQADGDHGALLSARGTFDPQLTTSVGRARADQLTPCAANPAALLPVLTNLMSYQLGVQQRLRSGILLTPNVQISRSDYSSVPGIATAQSSVQLNATVPLLKDRFGAITAASERAEEYGYHASTLSLRHTISQSTLDAATAYWSYVAAVKQLAVFVASEARAQEMLNDTQRLVDAEERAASDAEQAKANLAAKRVARMGAEQSVIEARAQLGIVMGIAANAIDTLALPATDFPAMRDTAALLPAGSDSALGDPLRQRADYAAAEQNERAAEALAASTQNDLKPRLDLTLGVGYVGTSNGFGVGHFIAPLYQNVPGLNASVQITYQLPITNTGAEGRAIEQSALYEQQRIARVDLARRIRSNVAVAEAALSHGHAALVESHQAVALAQTTVQNEQRKFRLDASTMFDVIQAQDALTNAELNEITSAQRYAVAIATLRFESGALAGADPASTVDVDRLLTPP